MTRYRPASPSGSQFISPAGAERMRAELDELWKVERPRVTQAVSEAAAQGDRSENAEYIYGKKRLREIDRRLNFLAGRLKHVEVVDPARQNTPGVVFFGATVEVEDEEGETLTYQIVGIDEVDPNLGRVSWRSPLGRSLLKRRVGDTVRYVRPEGEAVELTVTAVRYG